MLILVLLYQYYSQLNFVLWYDYISFLLTLFLFPGDNNDLFYLIRFLFLWVTHLSICLNMLGNLFFFFNILGSLLISCFPWGHFLLEPSVLLLLLQVAVPRPVVQLSSWDIPSLSPWGFPLPTPCVLCLPLSWCIPSFLWSIFFSGFLYKSV